MNLPTEKVSICVITYNHEAFIADALNSFLAQVGDFDLEIVVSDDASTDGTRDVIRTYQKRFPQIIKPIFNTTNLGIFRNFRQCLFAATGNYIAYCDGDDFFIDHEKITKQRDALERHPECSFSFHDCLIVGTDDGSTRKHSNGRVSRNWRTGVVPARTVIGAPLLVAHANTLMFKRQHLSENYFLNFDGDSGGDYQLLVYLASFGDGYFFEEAMSAYRLNDRSVSAGRRVSENLLQEIRTTHQKMNQYFQEQFRSEIAANYKGHYVHKLEADLHIAIKKGRLYDVIRSAGAFLIAVRGSQYSFRDAIWLLREFYRTRR